MKFKIEASIQPAKKTGQHNPKSTMNLPGKTVKEQLESCLLDRQRNKEKPDWTEEDYW